MRVGGLRNHLIRPHSRSASQSECATTALQKFLAFPTRSSPRSHHTTLLLVTSKLLVSLCLLELAWLCSSLCKSRCHLLAPRILFGWKRVIRYMEPVKPIVASFFHADQAHGMAWLTVATVLALLCAILVTSHRGMLVS